MKELTQKQIDAMADVVMMLFSKSVGLEISVINEMFFAYVNVEKLIETGEEDWPEMLIDNFNGGGYKSTHGGVIKCYNDIYSEWVENQIRLELQD